MCLMAMETSEPHVVRLERHFVTLLALDLSGPCVLNLKIGLIPKVIMCTNVCEGQRLFCYALIRLLCATLGGSWHIPFPLDCLPSAHTLWATMLRVHLTNSRITKASNPLACP